MGVDTVEYDDEQLLAQKVSTLKGRYEELSQDRFVFLQRARDASKLTIPSLIPPMGHTGSTILPTPWQGLGARGVNNLASKLMLALFPPNAPFFRLQVDAKVAAKIPVEAKSEFDAALAQIEQLVTTEVEVQALRVSLFESIKHLIVGGNILLYFPPVGGVKVFHLDSYVVKRDPLGGILEIVVQECIAPSALNDAEKSLITGKKNATEKTVERYTVVRKSAKGWESYQELNGLHIPGTEYTYPLDAPAWLALRWIKVDGEDYGRGYVEEYQGDMQSMDSLSQAIVEGSAASAKVLFLVNPAGTTSAKTLSESPNGAIREGNAEDVHCLQVDKQSDFRVALETIKEISERLSYAFMLNSSIQRNGERVTAEEIRFMAGELEAALGGVYSILSIELQLPLVRRLMDQMARQKKLPKLPKNAINPTIITGLEALGRGHDLTKLNLLLENLAPLGPEVINQYLNVSDYISRVATAVGINTVGLIKTPEQIAAAQQQAQAAQMVSTLGPDAIKAGGAIINKHGGLPPGINPNQQPQQQPQ